MAFYWNPFEFRLSSSAFLWGRLVFTDYNTGCFRKILLQSLNVSKSVASKYEMLGKINEDRHERLLQERGLVADVHYQREVEIKRKSARTPEVTISGHADFVYKDPATGRITAVDELKSVTSKNVRREVIGKGFFKTENLAQLVAYMGEFDVTQGALVYTYYEQDAYGEYEALDSRTFSVEIDEYGRIIVDTKPTEFTAYDVIAHRNAAVTVIGAQTVLDRPYRHDAPFVGACHWCPFKAICDRYDSGEIESTAAFVEKARQSLGGSDDVRTADA